MKDTFEYLFSTNEKGVAIHMGINPANGEDVIFTIREAGCEHHEKTQRKYQKALSMVRKNPKKEHEILSKIMAEAIIVDWSGITDKKGKKIPCTSENKLDALIKQKKLFYAILTEASREENFQDIEGDIGATEDATEKN